MFAQSADDDDRESLVNDATQKALERFDETMRELALLRYKEFEARTAAAADAICRRGDACAHSWTRGDLNWPPGKDEGKAVDAADRRAHAQIWHLAGQESGAGRRRRNSAQDVARSLKRRRAISQMSPTHWSCKQSRLAGFASRTHGVRSEASGRHSPASFCTSVSDKRTELWREQSRRGQLGTVRPRHRGLHVVCHGRGGRKRRKARALLVRRAARDRHERFARRVGQGPARQRLRRRSHATISLTSRETWK